MFKTLSEIEGVMDDDGGEKDNDALTHA